jgi:hypothetical protein
MIVKLRFTPLAMKFFKLHRNEYIGHGITPTLERAIGKKATANHVFAQDPLCGGKTRGIIYFNKLSIEGLTVLDVLKFPFQTSYEMLCEIEVLSRKD